MTVHTNELEPPSKDIKRPGESVLILYPREDKIYGIEYTGEPTFKALKLWMSENSGVWKLQHFSMFGETNLYRDEL